MTTVTIRKKLANYMKVADAKKIKAIYALFEDDIDQEEMEYSNELKSKLDDSYNYYKNGGNMVSASAVDKQIEALLKTGKGKI